MSRPIATAALLAALAIPQTAGADDEPAPETPERSWVQTLLPTLSLLGSG